MNDDNKKEFPQTNDYYDMDTMWVLFREFTEKNNDFIKVTKKRKGKADKLVLESKTTTIRDFAATYEEWCDSKWRKEHGGGSKEIKEQKHLVGLIRSRVNSKNKKLEALWEKVGQGKEDMPLIKTFKSERASAVDSEQQYEDMKALLGY